MTCFTGSSELLAIGPALSTLCSASDVSELVATAASAAPTATQIASAADSKADAKAETAAESKVDSKAAESSKVDSDKSADKAKAVTTPAEPTTLVVFSTFSRVESPLIAQLPSVSPLARRLTRHAHSVALDARLRRELGAAFFKPKSSAAAASKADGDKKDAKTGTSSTQTRNPFESHDDDQVRKHILNSRSRLNSCC